MFQNKLFNEFQSMKNDFGEKLSILTQSMSFVVSTLSKKKYVDASPDPDSGSLDDSSGSEGDAGEEDISAAFTDIDGKCDDKVVWSFWSYERWSKRCCW